MSYFPQKYTLVIEVKEDSGWDSKDLDFAHNKIEALKYELEKLVGDKLEVKIEYE